MAFKDFSPTYRNIYVIFQHTSLLAAHAVVFSIRNGVSPKVSPALGGTPSPGCPPGYFKCLYVAQLVVITCYVVHSSMLERILTLSLTLCRNMLDRL